MFVLGLFLVAMVHSLSSFIFPICILLLGLTIATARELPQTEVDDVAELSLPEGVGAVSLLFRLLLFILRTYLYPLYILVK